MQPEGDVCIPSDMYRVVLQSDDLCSHNKNDMSCLESLKIDLKGLKEGDSVLDFHLDDDYFKAIGGSEVRRGAVDVRLTIHRTIDFYELDFHSEGTVRVQCDICLDDMEQPVEADSRLTAKFGDEYAEDDDLITVCEDEGVLDVSWFVYEFIALAIPMRHAHGPGRCNPEMMQAIEKYSASGNSGDGEEASVDPRWNELKKLKTIIKD